MADATKISTPPGQLSRTDLINKLGSVDLNKVQDADAAAMARSAKSPSAATYLRGADIGQGLFNLLQQKNGETGDTLTVQKPDGTLTPAGQVLQKLQDARAGRDVWFDAPTRGDVLYADMRGVDMATFNKSANQVQAGPNSKLTMYWGSVGTSQAAAQEVAPQPSTEGVLLDVTGPQFAISRTGATSLWDADPSVKIDLKVDGLKEADAPLKIKAKDLNRDPSVARRPLSQWFFSNVLSVPEYRVATVKWFANGQYEGLRDVEEPLDMQMWKAALKAVDPTRKVPDDVWIFKSDWLGAPGGPGAQKSVGGGTLDKADLQYLKNAAGVDDGTQYKAVGDNQTYGLQTDSANADAGYNEFASFVKTVNGIGLTGANGQKLSDTDPSRFNTDAYRKSMEAKGDVYEMLRAYAGMNLAGCWDNLINPSNFAWVGEKGTDGQAKWTAMPVDLDSTWGLGWDGPGQMDWKNLDILLRPGPGQVSTENVPVIWKNLLSNDHFKAYVLDYMEYLVKTGFTPQSIGAKVEDIWSQRSNAAYQESDSGTGASRTQRPFTNDQIYQQNENHLMIHQNQLWAPPIADWVGGRSQVVQQQLADIRKTFTQHAGVDFASGQLAPPAQ